LQRAFCVVLALARQVHDCEQQVANLVFDRLSILSAIGRTRCGELNLITASR
jgi:hypothetical protein